MPPMTQSGVLRTCRRHAQPDAIDPTLGTGTRVYFETPIAASTTFLMFGLHRDMEEHPLIGRRIAPKTEITV